MGQHISKVLGSVLGGVLLAFLVAGCSGSGGTSDTGTGTGAGTGGGQTPTVIIGQGAGDTLPPSVTTISNPNPGAFQPQGSIQGVVRDAVRGLPLVGAQVSVSIPGASLGVTTVTTGASGQYSFTNVPASLWTDGSGSCSRRSSPESASTSGTSGSCPADGIVQFGELSAYTITVDLTFVNAALPGSTAKFPTTAFGEVVVGFANFADGNNALLCSGAFTGASCAPSEGGSGASTPVHGLTTALNFDIGRMTEAIYGKVRDAENGRVIVGAQVTLLDAFVTVTPTPAPEPAPGPPANGVRLSLDNAIITTAADGSFTFQGVPAAHCFNVEAQAPGYTQSGTLTIGHAPVCTHGGALTALVPATQASLGDLDGDGNIGCPTECLGSPGAGEIMLAPAVPGVDTTQPYVASASPADGADIDVTATGNPSRPIVLTFSEPMQRDNNFTRAVVATVDFKGQPVSPVGAPPGVTGPDGTVEVNTSWNSAGTVLTITPIRPWQAGLTYGVFIGGTVAPLTPRAGLVDLSGNPCCRCISLNVLGMATPGTSEDPAPGCGGSIGVADIGAVFGEGKPSPATLLFTTNGGPSVLDGPPATLGANSGDFNQSTATINWTAVAGARAYEVYMSIAGGDFQLIARTLPGNSPVTTLLSRSWSFTDALNPAATCASPLTALDFPCTAGVNPSAPTASVGNPNPRLSPGFEVLAAGRRVVEASIPDVGDDVSELPPNTPATPPGTVLVDTANALADLSDNFGAASQVRIAIATVNSNSVGGTLGSPVTLKDNIGPTTNGTQAGSTPLPACLLGAPCTSPAAANPTATTGRGQVVQDLFDPDDLNSDGNRREPDGIPDTILIGLSEPLAAATATCSTAAACAAIYQLRDAAGTTPTPTRLTAINITSATYDEDANGNGVLDSGEDTNGNGLLDTGSNVDRTGPGADTIKGNNFGNTFVWLRIAPATAGDPVDIRTGDFVAFVVDPAKTGTSNGVLSDLAGNGARAVDPTLPQNQLQDINRPQVISAVAANNPTGTADTIVVTFSEPMEAVELSALRIAGVNCAEFVTAPTFNIGDSSVTLRLNEPATSTCDLSRLAGDGTASSDFITFAATTTDLAENGLIPTRDALIFSGTSILTGAFVVTSTEALEDLPEDETDPQLTSVILNPSTTRAFVTLVFSERLSRFTFFPAVPTVAIRLSRPAAPATIDTCEGFTTVDQEPSTPTTFEGFVIGDRTVTLSIDVAAASAASGVAETCNVGANLATGNFIAMGAGGTSPVATPAATDLRGNDLDTTRDVAIFAGGVFTPGAQP